MKRRVVETVALAFDVPDDAVAVMETGAPCLACSDEQRVITIIEFDEGTYRCDGMLNSSPELRNERAHPIPDAFNCRGENLLEIEVWRRGELVATHPAIVEGPATSEGRIPLEIEELVKEWDANPDQVAAAVHYASRFASELRRKSW